MAGAMLRVKDTYVDASTSATPGPLSEAVGPGLQARDPELQPRSSGSTSSTDGDAALEVGQRRTLGPGRGPVISARAGSARGRLVWVNKGGASPLSIAHMPVGGRVWLSHFFPAVNGEITTRSYGGKRWLLLPAQSGPERNFSGDVM